VWPWSRGATGGGWGPWGGGGLSKRKGRVSVLKKRGMEVSGRSEKQGERGE